ncbi:MAG TPA: hypothetical protein VK875_08945 [Euzebyales bacterium]|nr:hypothetical protein [Euzebyales bacterium]
MAVVGLLLLNVAWPLPGQEDGRPWAAGFIAFPVAGALILMRRPRNRIGLVLSVVGAGAGAIFFGSWAVLQYMHEPWSPYLEALLPAALAVQFWGLLSLLYLFPSGSPATRGSSWAYAAMSCCVTVMVVVGVVRRGPLDLTGRDNPLGLGPPQLQSVFELGVFTMVISALLGVGALVGRYRRAGAMEQAQLKWFVSASGFVVLLIALITFVPQSTHAPPLVGALEFVIVLAGYWALPGAIVMAVLRYRLYDIDRLISRTITYAVVVGLLTALYAGGVFLLPAWLGLQGDLTVAASTLAAAALFNPLRRRVQHVVDRRFNRPRYDSEREIARFAAGLRHQVDLDGLTTALVGVAVTTLHPSAASVWIRPRAYR